MSSDNQEMRFIVLGAGAIGGVVGGRLFQHGYDVVFVARGAHYEAIRDEGLIVVDPSGPMTLRVSVAVSPGEIEFRPGDVVFLTVKSQDTLPAIQSLAAVAPVSTPIVCAQNGVENERVALRSFSDVYGMCVMCPTAHLEPGIVEARLSPIAGILDLGRYPSGSDETAEQIASSLAHSGFLSEAKTDISRWKFRKLLVSSVSNSVEAVLGKSAQAGDIVEQARREGEECLQAAGIDVVSEEEDQKRRADLPRPERNSRASQGQSSSQSLLRGTGSVEADYFNGEIAMLGRLFGVRTPVNATIQRYANRMARERLAPGTITEDELRSAIAAAGI